MEDNSAAKQVVELLQRSISKKREQAAATAKPGDSTALTASVVSKLKGFAKKGKDASPGPGTSASPAPSSSGSASGLLKRKPAS